MEKSGRELEKAARVSLGTASSSHIRFWLRVSGRLQEGEGYFHMYTKLWQDLAPHTTLI